MSLVYITYHNENVQDLDKIGGEKKAQKFKYTSKFKETIKKESQQSRLIVADDGKKLLASSGKCDHRTMGYVHTPLNVPSEFLRKKQGVKWLRVHDHICPRETHLPPVPRRPSTSIKPFKELGVDETRASYEFDQEHCNKKCVCQGNAKSARTNFIALNISKVKELQAKHPTPRFVDTPFGDRQNLPNTGLVPKYVFGKNFGKVPYYLRTHKNAISNVRDICTAGRSSYNQPGYYMNMYGTRKMTNEEREALLEGLKTNFMEQSKVFQRLSLFTDTLAKKLRKARIENVLRQLEQDIYLLEKNPVIYISNY